MPVEVYYFNNGHFAFFGSDTPLIRNKVFQSLRCFRSDCENLFEELASVARQGDPLREEMQELARACFMNPDSPVLSWYSSDGEWVLYTAGRTHRSGIQDVDANRREALRQTLKEALQGVS